MKKPNYIEIRLPGRKGTANAAIKGYFKRLRNKTLFVNFAETKQRKLFEYSVEEARLSHRCYWHSYRAWPLSRHYWRSYWALKLKLKVPKEI